MTRTPACNLVDRPTLRSFETRTSALALSASGLGVPSSISSSKGGDNSLGNLGVLKSDVNQMKSNLTPDELLVRCIKILEYNGYSVSKNS